MSRARAAKFLLPALLALTLAAFAILVSSAAAQTSESIPANPKVDIAYVPPTSQELEGVYRH